MENVGTVWGGVPKFSHHHVPTIDMFLFKGCMGKFLGNKLLRGKLPKITQLVHVIMGKKSC